MAVTIPVTQTQASIRESVELDGTRYRFRIYWNVRDEAWFMDLFDADDNPLVSGIKIVVDAALTSRFRYRSGMPQGQFIAFDTTNRQEPPGLEDFGTRVLLMYFSPDEVEA